VKKRKKLSVHPNSLDSALFDGKQNLDQMASWRQFSTIRFYYRTDLFKHDFRKLAIVNHFGNQTA
jgi:hypothetical protein